MWGDFVLFVTIGFAAQLVDGAVGMAYGLSATSVLLSVGTPPAVASASVHAAEVFTTGASGLAHWRLGNVDFHLVRRLALAGMLGGAVGAYLLTTFPAETIQPVIHTYLLLMGMVILWKAVRKRPPASEAPRHLVPLGLMGGFLDAVGGGGWGPMVATTLLGRGTKPRFAIGSVSLSEFFVTSTISVTFLGTIGLSLWPIIAGLVVGGMLAAPFAAYAARAIPDRPLMILIGCVITLLSTRGLIQSVGG